MRFNIKKLLLFVFLGVFAFTGIASALENQTYIYHTSSVRLTQNGTPDYNNATFDNISIEYDFNRAPIAGDEQMTGTLKIAPASYTAYTYSDGSSTTIEGSEHTFDVSCAEVGSDYVAFVPKPAGQSGYAGQFIFQGNAENRTSGLPGKAFTWSFPSGNIEGKFPDFLTTADQIASGAPDIELTNATLTAKIAKFTGNYRIDIRFKNGERKVTNWISVSANQNVEETYQLSSFPDRSGNASVNRDDIRNIIVALRAAQLQTATLAANYNWRFDATTPYDPTTPTTPTNPTNNGNNSSGGGCNANVASGMIILAVALFGLMTGKKVSR